MLKFPVSCLSIFYDGSPSPNDEVRRMVNAFLERMKEYVPLFKCGLILLVLFILWMIIGRLSRKKGE